MELEKEIEALVESAGAKLYDISTVNERGETIYRVSIISNDGKTDIDKCVEITHLISPLLDVTPPIKGEYRLEVSSPGIERDLKKDKHYKLSVGELVKITTNDNFNHKGKLVDFKDGTITLQTKHETLDIDLKDIKKAKTYFQW